MTDSLRCKRFASGANKSKAISKINSLRYENKYLFRLAETIRRAIRKSKSAESLGHFIFRPETSTEASRAWERCMVETRTVQTPECVVQCRICRVHVLENRCPVNLVRSGRIDAIRNRNRRGLQGRRWGPGWLSFAKRLPKRHCAISRERNRGRENDTRRLRFGRSIYW